MARPVEECWEWDGVKSNRSGYGIIQIEGRRVRVHRLSYEVHVGPIPDGMIVRHTCDNPPCLNPHHLQLGTQDDNMQDMKVRGRSSRGVARSNHKLTDRQVMEINSRSSETSKSLAREYGVSEWTIRGIRTGKRWSHVTGLTCS
ncbi:hypothetical protein BKE56_015630 [Rhodococcus sp. M8]|nr:hypothetical protein BKE56_015630 [Rhodococcus sp. M8]